MNIYQKINDLKFSKKTIKIACIGFVLMFLTFANAN